MLGFEISFNEEVIRASIDNGLMEIIFMGGGLGRKDSLLIWGLTSFHKVKWYSANVECDKITVRIIDVNHNSESTRESRFKNDGEMLQRYYELKQELEREGLL